MRFVMPTLRLIAVVAAWTLVSLSAANPVSAQDVAGIANLAGQAPGVAAEKLYAAALEAEFAGNGPLSNRLLRQAIQLSPDFAPARWRLGQIRDERTWRTVDELAQRWAADPRLDEYQRRRNALRDDFAGNLALARWATRSALREEAEVHWRRVRRYQPTHSEAVKSLGLKRLNGRWLTHREYKAAAEDVQQAKRAAKSWRPRIVALRRDLESHAAADRARGLAEFRAIVDRRAIATLQDAYSLADPRDPFRPIDANAPRHKREKAWNLEYVALLGRWPEIEATNALLREAVLSPVDDVRIAAGAELARRPLHHVVPRLLAGLVAPIDARVSLSVDERGRVFYRRTFFREGPLADFVTTYDDFYQNFVAMPVYYADGFIEDVVVEQPVPGERVVSLESNAGAMSAAVALANWRIGRMNERIFATARRATLVDLPSETTDWWRWWQDFNELYVPAEKPLYERTYANYYAPYPQGGWYYPVSCFAAGTRVMTKTGPRPIESIRIGDLVLAQDPATGELAFKAVIDRTARPAAPLLAIGLGAESIRATRGHPFWVAGENWQMAKFLRQGDRLHTAAGPTPISQIAEAPPEATYNLLVADWHNYFVGDRRVLVHDNAPQQPTVMRLPGMR